MDDHRPHGRKRLIALLLPLLLAWTEPLAAQTPGPQAPQAQTAGTEAEMVDLLNIDLRADVRLFTVLAALNASGFDFEVPGKDMAPLRARLRDELTGLDPDLRRRLRVHLGLHRRGDARSMQTAYTSLALLIDGPPDFRLLPDAPAIPWDVQGILGFEELLPDFYRQARVAELWERFRPEYERELEAYRPVIRQAIQQALDYLRIPQRIVLDRKVVIMADLLSHQDVVNARNLEKTYYLVLGPAATPASNLEQVQHEYLHFLVDPIVEKHSTLIMKQREHQELAERQPGLARDFRGRFLLVVGESLIEAVMHRLHPPPDLEAATAAMFRRGLIYFPYFLTHLQQFENTVDVQLPVYLEQVFAGMNKAELSQVEKDVTAYEARTLAARQAEEEALAREQAAYELRQEIRRLLNEAGGLMGSGRFAEARESLRRLLELAPGNGSALFYLAQASTQLGDLEAAIQAYTAVESAPDVEVWVKAWSAVRLGRILAHQGQFEAARARFEAVLNMEGDLRGAADDARQSLTMLPKNN